MKKLFERLFKKEPEFDYIIAEYQPVKIDRTRMSANLTEYEAYQPQGQDEIQDEMQIDKIYQRM